MPTGLAYHLLMMHRLLGEADAAALALDLPEPHPLQIEHVQQKMIVPPGVRTDLGTIFTGRYTYTFANDRFQIANPKLTRVSSWSSLAGQPSSLATNSARELALKWLSALRVDTNQLLKSPLIVTQFSLPLRAIGDSKTEPVRLPIFLIRAGISVPVPSSPTRSNYQVEVRILGTTAELIDLQVKDWSVVSRPAFSIRDPRLLALYPDEALQKLTNSPGFQMSELEGSLYATADRTGAAKTLLLSEANRLRSELGLGKSAWESNVVHYCAIAPPRFGRVAIFQVSDYEFVYSARGRLLGFRNLDAFAPDAPEDETPGGPDASGVGIWSVEQLAERATELLTTLGVEFPSAKSADSRKADWMTSAFPSAPGQRNYPVARVVWGDWSRPAISCVISGKDGRLLRASFAEAHAPAHQPLASLESGFTPKEPVPSPGSVWRRPPWAPPFDATPEALNVWYAERLGGSNKLEAIRSPETVTAVLIKKKTESKIGDYSASAFEIIGSSIEIKVEEAMPVCSWLGDLSNFNLHLFPFAPDYCARLTFKRGNDTVECLVAVNETYLRLSSGEHFVPWLSYQGKPSLRHLLRRAFPEHEPFQ
jgi:hypothetical protein